MESRDRSEASLVVEHGRPFVELEFPTANRRARALLDTGGLPFIVGAALGRDLGLTPELQEVDGSTRAVVKLPETRIGDVALPTDGCLVVQHESDVIQEGFGNEAFVPAHVLTRHDVLFDYPGRSFALDSEDDPIGSRVPVPSRPKPGWPAITVTIAGEEVNLLLDTGAPCCMFSERLVEKLAPSIAARTEGAFGLANMNAGKWEASCETIRVPDLVWGDLHFPSVVAVSRPEGNFERIMSFGTPIPVVGAIAGNVLRHLRLDWRPAAQAAWIEAPATVEDPLTQVPLTLHSAEGRVRVVGVGAGGVRGKVELGDELLAVDGVPIAAERFGDAVALLSGEPGDGKTLELARDGQVVEVLTEVFVVV